MNQLSRNLSIGQGGTGLGATRVHPNGVFIPRNAPPLVNLNLLDGRARGVQAVDPCFARSGICLQRHIPVSRFLTLHSGPHRDRVALNGVRTTEQSGRVRLYHAAQALAADIIDQP